MTTQKTPKQGRENDLTDLGIDVRDKITELEDCLILLKSDQRRKNEIIYCLLKRLGGEVILSHEELCRVSNIKDWSWSLDHDCYRALVTLQIDPPTKKEALDE